MKAVLNPYWIGMHTFAVRKQKTGRTDIGLSCPDDEASVLHRTTTGTPKTRNERN